MIGRTEQLASLNQNYISEKNNLTILYGRHGMGKTTLIKEFIKDKDAFYYEALPADGFEQVNKLANAANFKSADYYDILSNILNTGINVFVFEEFHNFIKNGKEFMEAVCELIKSEQKVMVVLSCSSVSWVENSMVKTIGPMAFSINTFMKLKELSYSDAVGKFPELDTMSILSVYGITGGNPDYLGRFDAKKSIKDNVCDIILKRNGALYSEAFNFLKDEFREIGVYNAILYCLANGMNKLNDMHEYTGYGRDKISVYLKNLIAREIAEKIFSYDVFGNENTKKGLYRIKDGFLNFWYRYVYPYAGMLNVTEASDFYGKYIDGKMGDFLQDAFIKIASEFMEIMNDMDRLPMKVEKKGSWYGKAGNLHLIFEDEEGNAIIAQTFVKTTKVNLDDLQEIKENVKLAGINAKYFYLFAMSGFEDGVEGDDVTVIGIDDL